jgi:hypothetical protein
VKGERLDVEVRLVGPDGTARSYRTIGELQRHPDGTPARLRGSNQDITEQRAAEHALATATATREAAAREHRIADALNAACCPPAPSTPITWTSPPTTGPGWRALRSAATGST